MKKKAKLDKASVWVEFLDVGYGCKQALAWRRGWPVPIGVVWYQAFTRKGGSLLQVFESYVLPHARRLGVRTLIHRAMETQHPSSIFVTGDMPSKSGAAWMSHMGFHYSHHTGQMFRGSTVTK